MFGIGMQELLVILAIALVLFGGKKLPEIGQNLGKAIRGFKESADNTEKEPDRRIPAESEPQAPVVREARVDERKAATEAPAEPKKS